MIINTVNAAVNKSTSHICFSFNTTNKRSRRVVKDLRRFRLNRYDNIIDLIERRTN